MTLLISGVGAFSVYAWRGSRTQPPRASSISLPSPPLDRQPQIQLPLQVVDKFNGCPKCGAPMRKRLAKRGKFRGREFMGCSRYPRCDGIRALGDVEDAPTAPNK
uniref:topoisomerase DNA-binding C4 zinc finger domain-containing protein n=1 Tax=Pleomorphomonas koreensis TaxID=257440 RepID=UPI0009FFCCA4